MKRLSVVIAVSVLAIQSLMAGPPGSGWVSKFSDQFSGSAISGNWNVANQLDYDKYGRTCYYRPGNVRVANSTLIIDNKWHTPRLSGADYTGGRVTTKGTWTYGYFESRCRITWWQNSIWPTFWMYGSGNEFDIMELQPKWNAYPGQVHHWPGGSKTYWANGYKSEDYHLWAVLWNYNEVSFWVDGGKKLTSPSPASARGIRLPMWVTSSPNRELQPAKSGSYPSMWTDIISIWQK